MSEYSEKAFAKDFIIRTQYNLKQLEQGPYEVTQLVNSTVGLLMIPKEDFFNQITNKLIDNKLLTQMRVAIKVNSYVTHKKNSSLKDIVIHIRNGIAHNNTKFHSKEKEGLMEIDSVTIWDHRNKNDASEEADFEITLSIELLKKFLIEFSTNITKTNKTNQITN